MTGAFKAPLAVPPSGRAGFARASVGTDRSDRLDPVVDALGATTLVLPYLDEAVLRPRHSPLDQQQVLLGVDLVHRQPDLRDALAAHPAGHLDPLEHARRRGRGADRARLADVVRAVRDRAAAEVVALDRAREALADSNPGDLDALAGLESLDGHRLTGRQLARAAELDQLPVRACLAELAEPG